MDDGAARAGLHRSTIRRRGGWALGWRRLMVLTLGAILLCVVLPAARSGQPALAAPRTITGLHVAGNTIVDGAGNAVRLLGVSRSGTEYMCALNDAHGFAIFDGPNDQASLQAIVAWHVNAVRVPLNEDCWLDVNLAADNPYKGAPYRQAIVNYVNLLNANGLIAILELHVSAPGATVATLQAPMPDRDHSLDFWANSPTSVANTFKNSSAVIFDLFNEPWPNGNTDNAAAWACWKNGSQTPAVPLTTCPGNNNINGNNYGNYQAAGMQELVTAVRGTGATNVILLGGVVFSGSPSQWLANKPTDLSGNLGASWHVYDFSTCHPTPGCWDTTSQISSTAAQVPLVATEIGETDCAHGFIDPLMAFLDARSIGYLAWTWDAAGGWTCQGGPTVISDYSGTPTQTYGQGYHDHLAALASLPTNTPTRTPTAGSTPTRTSTPTSTPQPASVTPTLTPLPLVCAPRPGISITAVPNGDGRLRVTVAATANPGSGPNLLQSLQFTQLDNAIVDVGGQTAVTGTFSVQPPTQSLTLYVRRATAGAASTVRLNVQDGCGAWPTLVGGGPSAF
jgi:hypothetical protein